MPFGELSEDTKFSVTFIKPSQFKVAITIKPVVKAELLKKSDGDWVVIKEIADVAVQDIFEIGVPFRDIDAKGKRRDRLFYLYYKK